MRVAIVLEVVAGHTVGAEHEVDALGLGFLNDGKGQVELVFFADGLTHVATERTRKGVGHATTKDEVVHLVHEVFDDADFGRHLRATHNGGEGTLDVVEDVVDSLHFFLHEVTEHLVVGIEVVGNDSGGGVLAVSGAEGIHHVVVGIGSEGLGKLLLAFLHGFLRGIIGGVGLVDAHRLAFLFGIETEIFEQQHFAGLEGCRSFLCFGAVGSKGNGSFERCGYGLLDSTEGELGVDFAFGLAHVAHDDESAAIGKNLFEGGEGAADAGVVGDFSFFVEGHIEVYADDSLLTCEITSVDSHNSDVYLLDFVDCFIGANLRKTLQGRIVRAEKSSKKLIFVHIGHLLSPILNCTFAENAAKCRRWQ